MSLVDVDLCKVSAIFTLCSANPFRVVTWGVYFQTYVSRKHDRLRTNNEQSNGQRKLLERLSVCPEHREVNASIRLAFTYACKNASRWSRLSGG
jgi:hypothetical protein